MSKHLASSMCYMLQGCVICIQLAEELIGSGRSDSGPVLENLEHERESEKRGFIAVLPFQHDSQFGAQLDQAQERKGQVS